MPFGNIRPSVVVPVPVVGRVTVTVVHVVDVAAVRHGHMPASFAVRVSVVRMFAVVSGLTLVHVIRVLAVEVTVVHVVDVVTVRNRHMPAPFAVRVLVTRMRLMLNGRRHATHLHVLRAGRIRCRRGITSSP